MLDFLIKRALAGGTVTLYNPLGERTIETILTDVFSFLRIIGVFIFGVMILYGAYKIMAAAGKSEKAKEGRKIIIYAIIGYAIIISVSAIMALIKSILGI